MIPWAHKINYYALIVSILTKCTPELAFKKLLLGRVKNEFTEADYADMAKLRKRGLSLKELSDIYGIDASSICQWTKGRVV